MPTGMDLIIPGQMDGQERFRNEDDNSDPHALQNYGENSRGFPSGL